MTQNENYQLVEAGRIARREYLKRKPVSLRNAEMDEVLEGGLESGNFYLFLGSAKSGKSTILRCFGIEIAKHTPVLYANFEQPGENVYAKIYTMAYGKDFRSHIHADPEMADLNIEKLPNDPFYVAFWPKRLESCSFNVDVKDFLKQAVEQIEKEDEEHRKPIIILENLSDIYNERLGSRDNLVNVVTQTAQDIKRFAMNEGVSVLLAHHTGKVDASEPTLDDVRDSKRVVDLAHSIFIIFAEREVDPMGFEHYTRYMKYVAGRGSGDPKRWRVDVTGLDLNLVPHIVSLDASSGKRGIKRRSM